MSEAANAATPKKAKETRRRQKTASSHPKYLEMAMSAIGQLGERNGSSRQAIHKYIMGKYNVGKDPKVVNTHLKMALKRGVTTGVLKHVKGQGASGSFRLMSSEKTEKKPPVVKAKPKAAAVKAKKPKVSKPVKKVATPKKKKVAAKPKPKPVKKVKKAKPAKPKSPKPKAAKKPPKAAPKPKKAKSTKKGRK